MGRVMSIPETSPGNAGCDGRSARIEMGIWWLSLQPQACGRNLPVPARSVKRSGRPSDGCIGNRTLTLRPEQATMRVLHQLVVGNLHLILTAHVRRLGLGEVFLSPIDVPGPV